MSVGRLMQEIHIRVFLLWHHGLCLSNAKRFDRALQQTQPGWKLPRLQTRAKAWPAVGVQRGDARQYRVSRTCFGSGFNGFIG